MAAFIFSSLFMAKLGIAQPYPQNYFTAPMDTPLYLSAPFGSLRDNHFHSGMDIRTFEKEGLPIYAVADGYISRIKFSPVGYGKAIYIDHPNGYTSVYGHLKQFDGAIAAYIKAYQYQLQRYDFDHFPERNALKVVKGQLIGYSGNSGTSSGPHLHFEIRDTKAEEPINPLLFGIKAMDSLPPLINRVAVYNLMPNKPTIIASHSISTKNTLATDSGFVLLDTLYVNATKIGLGIETYDYLINKTKEYSVYCADVFTDGKKLFTYRLDRLNFSDTKYINAHIDYEVYKLFGYRINKCFLDDGNKIAIYPYMRNKGMIQLDSTNYKHIQFCSGDVYGNTYTLHVILKSTGHETPTETPCAEQVFYPNKDNTFRASSIVATIPAGALYDTLNPCLQIDLPRVKGALSNLYQVHNSNTPLHKPITIAIKTDSVGYANKLLISTQNKNNQLRAVGGAYSNGWVTAQTTSFGIFTVTADTVAPRVKVLRVNKKGEVRDTALTVLITDDESGIDTYNAYVNGKWILMEYDAKSDMLTYFFDEKTVYNQKQELQLIVVDKKGNSTTITQQLEFKK